MNDNLERAMSASDNAYALGNQYAEAKFKTAKIALERQQMKADIITRLCTGDNGKAFPDPRTGKAYTPTSAGDAASVDEKYMKIKEDHARAELAQDRAFAAWECARITALACATHGDANR
jgi:hypothetical protein